MIVDFHAHCFPDALALRAMPKMQAAAGITAALNGTLDDLRRSMQKAGIAWAVLQPIATKPGQEKNINQWAADSQRDGILSFGTVHPDSPGFKEEIRRIKDLGLAGVKFHPDYQGFHVDEPRMFPVYEAVCRAELPILLHAGVDIAFPPPCHCPPARLARVVDLFPEGRWIAAHMGGFRLWEQVEAHLLGKPLYLDTSFSHGELGAERMLSLIRAHGVERVLFGSDSPWADQAQAVAQMERLGLLPEEWRGVMGGNAARLLGLAE